MRRRDFLKTATATAFAQGIPSSARAAKPALDEVDTRASETNAAPTSSSRYRLKLEAADDLLPKLPVSINDRVPPKIPIAPMPVEARLRRKIVPRRGICSIAPGSAFTDTLLSGNGSVIAEWTGHPYFEQVQLHHERLMLPWARPFEAPRIAYVLPRVQQLLLSCKYREGLDLAFDAMQAAGLPMNTKLHQTIAACSLEISLGDPRGPVLHYLRTLDFESGEVCVNWSDRSGSCKRRAFVSRPDNVVAQWLTAPAGKQLTFQLSVKDPTLGTHIGSVTFAQHWTEDSFTFTGQFDPAVNRDGYAVVTRIVRSGGQARQDGNTLHIDGADSVLLLTRIEWLETYSDDAVLSLHQQLATVPADYEALLNRHRPGQAEAIGRVTLDLGGLYQATLSGEELLSLQRTSQTYVPALLEKIFDMGRYWLLAACGKFPAQPMAGEVNININLQVSHGTMGALPEAMSSYFNWIESLLPDCRNNAENIFGTRGAVYPILPNKDIGVSFLYASTVNAGTWPHPYWISAGGWCYSPFWDHFLVTDDRQFLRERVMPGLKEIALFYEDFLKHTDDHGNYVFVPSFCPENWPEHAEPASAPGWPLPNEGWPNMPAPTPLVINAAMDIMVCREVLTHLIEAAAILGSEQENVPKWRAMLSKMPPYLTTADGTLKEWGWPGLDENYDQRHVSHLYGVWPSDEINPGTTPELARAALLADRKRGPSNNSAHGLCHRALAGARLKDSYLVDFELRQMLQQGYFNNTLRSSHNPYRSPMPDAQGGVPTILMECLLYARPGFIEVLPALPESLQRGSIRGMLARTFAKVNELRWDLPSHDLELTLTSLRDQQITLVVWHGIASIKASEPVAVHRDPEDKRTCTVALKQGRTLALKVKLASSRALPWIGQPG